MSKSEALTANSFANFEAFSNLMGIFHGIQVVKEISDFGDSKTYGPTLRNYDRLLTIPETQRSFEERAELNSLRAVLANSFSEGGLLSVYSVWKNQEALRTPPPEPVNTPTQS